MRTVNAAIASLLFVTGSSIAAPTFPLKVSANGRYLVDQANVPFRIQGDSPWDLLVSITSAEVDTYLANRNAKKFNTLLVELVEHRAWRSGSPAPANRNGDRAFLRNLSGGTYAGAGDLADLSTPNDAYFAYVDTVLARAAANGMLVLLNPLYVGYGAPTAQSASNEGWSADMNANSSSNCYRYGQYVGDRYRNQKNLIWVHGGDAFQPAAAIVTCEQQVMQGIKDGKGSGGSTVLHTTHWSRGRLSTDDPSLAVQVNSVYSDPTTVSALCRNAYARASVLPAYLIEAYYEGEHSMTPAQLRAQDYRAVLSCIGGNVFGNAPLWDFDSGWQSALDATGSLDWQRAGALFDAIAWQDLVPSNLGTLSGTVLVPGADMATGGDVAAAASTLSLIAYVPSTGTSPRAITVTMTPLASMSRARWYNPTTGTWTDITGGAYSIPNSGTRSFTTPGNNGSGNNDWVLVIDAQGAAPPPPTNLRVVEYYNATFDHYFMTADAEEMSLLDSGAFGGSWARTGLSFGAYTEAVNNAVPVCRYFSASFAPKSSHFYSAFAGECSAVAANPDWLFEGVAFQVPVPDTMGHCLSGTLPIHRLYNNGQGGAPNHRFVADDALVADFVDHRGYVSEGYGDDGVVMCSPS
jgi:hypothetical protein